MKKIITFLFTALLLIPAFNYAQYEGGHTFTSNGSDLEIGGFTVFFYQYRPKYTGDTKSSKNNVFTVDDARLSLRGDVKGKLFFHFEYNFAALASWLGVDPTVSSTTPQPAAPTSSPKDQPITELHFTYKIPVCGIQIKVGYGKIPFGLLNLQDKLNSAFLERWKFGNGDYDPRRDAGIQLYKDFWRQRINITGGIFSGMGENIVYGVQDHQGTLMYAGRAEFMNAYYRWDEYDKSDKARPVFRVGVNVKYNEKNQFSGDGTTNFSLTNVRTVDGQKFSYGGDAAICWHGFSAIYEIQQHKITPHNDPGNGLTSLLNSVNFLNNSHITHLLDGGYYVELAYWNRKYLMGGVAVRLDSYNLSENIDQPGYNQKDRSLTFAYNFQFPRMPLMFRFHYAYRLPLPHTAGPAGHWAEDEMRTGFVYQF